jgi:hypothetical protein
LGDPAALKSARTAHAQASDTSAISYALHCMLNVMPSLDSVDNRKTCMLTLQGQIKSAQCETSQQPLPPLALLAAKLPKPVRMHPQVGRLSFHI